MLFTNTDDDDGSNDREKGRQFVCDKINAGLSLQKHLLENLLWIVFLRTNQQKSVKISLDTASLQPRHPHHHDHHYQGYLVRPRPPVDRSSLGPRRHVCHLPGKHLLVTHRHHHVQIFFCSMSYHGE